jgi:hypothetical protein
VNHLGLVIFSAAAFMGIQTAAHAGACGDEIAGLQKVADATQSRRFVGPTENQSVGAQLHHQPTPESIAVAENMASGRVDAVLKRAKTLDEAGKEADCMNAVGEAKLLLGLE